MKRKAAPTANEIIQAHTDHALALADANAKAAARITARENAKAADELVKNARYAANEVNHILADALDAAFAAHKKVTYLRGAHSLAVSRLLSTGRTLRKLTQAPTKKES
jgi:hypothetical protein